MIKNEKNGVTPRQMMNLATVLLLAWASATVSGQAPAVASFRQNGLLVCTNLQPGTTASVLWARSVLGPWTNTWTGPNGVAVDSNGTIQISVPMTNATAFCRVRGVGLTNSGLPPFPAPSNMVWVAAGTFTMGSPVTEPTRASNEGPQTQVTLSRGFCIGKREVTQAEYLALIGSNPSSFTGDLNRPVEQVSWGNATNYCGKLTARELAAARLPVGYKYRLPTEAEWEYACRAGTTTPFHYGDGLHSGMADFNGRLEYPPCGGNSYYCFNAGGTYLGHTTAVGTYAPNAWGLYDMHGDVWEWCQDWYSAALPGGSVTDPQGPGSGSDRVARGGGWANVANACRSAFRDTRFPTDRWTDLGFRIVLAPAP